MTLSSEGGTANLERRAAMGKAALDLTGSQQWNRDAKGNAHCHDFVAETDVIAGAPKPLVKKAGGALAVPGPAEWAKSKIPNYRLMTSKDMPQPGDKFAWKAPAGADFTGHVTIITKVDGYRFQFTSASERNGVRPGPWYDFRQQIQTPSVGFQRYTGE